MSCSRGPQDATTRAGASSYNYSGGSFAPAWVGLGLAQEWPVDMGNGPTGGMTSQGFNNTGRAIVMEESMGRNRGVSRPAGSGGTNIRKFEGSFVHQSFDCAHAHFEYGRGQIALPVGGHVANFSQGCFSLCKVACASDGRQQLCYYFSL